MNYLTNLINISVGQNTKENIMNKIRKYTKIIAKYRMQDMKRMLVILRETEEIVVSVVQVVI